PSDGYGTAFTLYVLQQAGVQTTDPRIARGVQWLKKNQRVSGRWFTPTPAQDPTEGGVGTRDLYIQNMGTVFALLALEAGGAESAAAKRDLRRLAGLSVRERVPTN